MSNTRARKPGGGRKPSKPEYSAAKNLAQQMKAAADLYTDKMNLQAIADTLSLNPIKVRKLLITAGVYESAIAETVQHTFHKYRETQSYKDAILSTASERVCFQGLIYGCLYVQLSGRKAYMFHIKQK